MCAILDLLEYEIDRDNLVNELINESMKDGIEEGIEKIVRYMLSMGKSVDAIVEDTGIAMKAVQKVEIGCNIAKANKRLKDVLFLYDIEAGALIDEAIGYGMVVGIWRVVHYMLGSGKSVDTIAEDTGLTKEEIGKIEESIWEAVDYMLDSCKSIDTVIEDTGIPKEKVLKIARERSK